MNKRGYRGDKTDQKYIGWANYETWNVALWINNDEGLYSISKHARSYHHFKKMLNEMGLIHTKDGVSYNDPSLDIQSLDRVIEENN